MDVTEKEADIYQQILKDMIPQFKEAGVSLFIWDEEQNQSVAGWLADAVNGELKDYGLDLVDKQY